MEIKEEKKHFFLEVAFQHRHRFNNLCLKDTYYSELTKIPLTVTFFTIFFSFQNPPLMEVELTN